MIICAKRATTPIDYMIRGARAGAASRARHLAAVYVSTTPTKFRFLLLHASSYLYKYAKAYFRATLISPRYKYMHAIYSSAYCRYFFDALLDDIDATILLLRSNKLTFVFTCFKNNGFGRGHDTAFMIF